MVGRIRSSYYKFQNMELGRSRSATKLTNQTNNPFVKYEIAELLGQGQFGKVYKAHLKHRAQTSHPDSNVCAIKIIPLAKLKKNPKLKQLLTNEIHILSSLNHPHIISFRELFVYEDKIFMVYEHCQGGNLEDMLPLTEAKAISIFTKIIKACAFAQKNHILHRDLKPANILFKGGEPRVADWGFSRYLKEELTATSFVGSPAYMAPELLNGSEYTNKADVWSFGVMVYECLFNEMPWSARNIKQLLAKVKTSPLTMSGIDSPILKTILKLSLQIDPEKRASFDNLLKSIRISKRVLSTNESYENPEQNSQLTELSQSDIRKCSSYLEFAKHSQTFKDEEAKILCLDLILFKLRKIKNKYSLKAYSFESELTQCYSQRKMASTRREITTPKKTNKSAGRDNLDLQLETHALLNKEIALIEKIKGSLPTPSIQWSTPQKNKSQKHLIKQLVKKVVKSISISQKSVVNQSRGRKELIELSCMMQIIMYQELEHQGKDVRLCERIRQMQQLGLSSLMRMVNCRVLYINQHYCKN